MSPLTVDVDLTIETKDAIAELRATLERTKKAIAEGRRLCDQLDKHIADSQLTTIYVPREYETATMCPSTLGALDLVLHQPKE